MRLLIDMHPFQARLWKTESANAVITLVEAIAKAGNSGAVTVALNGAFSSSAAELSEIFRKVLPAGAVRIWYGSDKAAGSANARLEPLFELVRAEVILDHDPHALLICGTPASTDESCLPEPWSNYLSQLPAFFVASRIQPPRPEQPGFERSSALDAQQRRDAALTLSVSLKKPPAHQPEQLQILNAESPDYSEQAAECARKIWTALGAMTAHRAISPRRTGQARPRLAMVTPVPPQTTGIADYSAELAPAMARLYDISIVSEVAPDPKSPLGNFPWIRASNFGDVASKFDRLVYQIGNSPFHQFQIEDLLPRYPGMVVLHDVFLNDYRWAYADALRRPARIEEDLAAAHGYPAVVAAKKNGLSEALKRLPCSAPVISAGVGAILHSEHAVQLLKRHHGARLVANSWVIPHLRAALTFRDRAEARRDLGVSPDEFLVCSFGEVGRKKLPHIIFEGWSRVFGRTPDKSRLVYAGKVHDHLDRAILDEAKMLGCRGQVIMTGRVDRPTYLDWLAAADVAIQLRGGSNGESSGAVADCLAAGLPVILNRHGSFAEFPESAVYFVPDSVTADDVAGALTVLSNSEAARGKLSNAARSFVHDKLAPDRIAGAYRDAIEAAYTHGPVAGPLSIVRAVAAEYPCLLPRERAVLARAMAATWPAVRQSQFLIEAGDCVIPKEWRRILTTLLSGESTGTLRPEPCRFGEAGLVSAHEWAARLLDIPHRAAGTEIMPQSGDVFLALQKESGEVEIDELRRVRMPGAEIGLLLRPNADRESIRTALSAADFVVCSSSEQAAKVTSAARQLGSVARIVASDEDDWVSKITGEIDRKSAPASVPL
jgi:glycosyltransferase involved in cell wall biosynthesis